MNQGGNFELIESTNGNLNNSTPKVIWGTNIVISDIISTLKLFMTTFSSENSSSPKYLNDILQVLMNII